jgi:plastocyanin
MKKAIIGLSVMTVLAMVLVACSSSAAPAESSSKPAESKPAAAQSASGSAEVVMSGFKFQPAELTVKMGTKVTFTNNDSAGHDVVASDGSFNSGTLNKGQTFSMVFDKEGTFSYVCTFHPGMDGKIIVIK